VTLTKGIVFSEEKNVFLFLKCYACRRFGCFDQILNMSWHPRIEFSTLIKETFISVQYINKLTCRSSSSSRLDTHFLFRKRPVAVFRTTRHTFRGLNLCDDWIRVDDEIFARWVSSPTSAIET
jgi:hypothetical protein